MPMIHMVHGFVGAGKTSYARRLEQELPAMRFTHDEWMSRLYGEDPPARQFPELYGRVADQIARLWPRCIALGMSVVLDSGFWSRAERDALRARARQLGAQIRLHAVICPEDVAWARVSRRNSALNGSLFISRATFELLRARVEPLADDEPHVVVETKA